MKIFGGEVIAVAMLLAGATGAGARTVVSQATGEPISTTTGSSLSTENSPCNFPRK